MRDDLIALEVAVEVRRIVEKRVVGVQLIGLAAESADRLQAEHELRFGLYAAPLDLLVGRSLGGEPRNLLEDRALELAERMSRRGGRGDLRVAGDLARVLRRRHVGGQPLVEDQPAIE